MKDYRPSNRIFSPKSLNAHKKRSHVGMLIQAVELLSHHLFGFFVLIVFTSILLSLPLTLTYLLQGIGSIAHAVNQNAQISVYLTPGLDDAATNDISNTLKARTDTAFLGFISPQQGLKQFEKQSGIEKLKDYLNTNPIPGVILLKVVLVDPRLDELDQLTAELAAFPGVESVAMNGQWLTHAISVIQSISLSIAIATAISFFLILVIIIMLLNFLLPESLNETSKMTMVYLGILLGIITGIIADYWVSYFAHFLDQFVGQLAFLNLKTEHFHLGNIDIFINQFGSWLTLIIAALVVRHYRLRIK